MRPLGMLLCTRGASFYLPAPVPELPFFFVPSNSGIPSPCSSPRRSLLHGQDRLVPVSSCRGNIRSIRVPSRFASSFIILRRECMPVE